MVNDPDRGQDPDATVPEGRPVGPIRPASGSGSPSVPASGEDDATQVQGPVAGDATQVQGSAAASAAGGDDATRVQQPAAGGDDATQVQGPVAGDATPVQQPAAGGDDATQVQQPASGGAAATRVGGPVGDTAALPAQQPPPRWAARANVPPPGTGPRRPAPPPWDDEAGAVEDPYGGRSWFTPVIVGIVALLLAAALGFGIWLIYRATKNNAPTVGTSASELVSSAPASPAPSSEPPSPSASPTPSPTTPAGVPLPALRGETEQSARDALSALGLNVIVQRRSDPTVEPGRVIDTDPRAGTTVPAGSTVTLIVASAPPPSPSNSSKAPSAAAS